MHSPMAASFQILQSDSMDEIIGTIIGIVIAFALMAIVAFWLIRKSKQSALTKEFAPCPNCRTTRSSIISFTWWGGALGPKLLTHVRCSRCGTQYNGKTGKLNTTGIAIYVAVGFLIGTFLFGYILFRYIYA